MNGRMCIIMNVYILVYVCAHTYNYESVHTHVYTYMHEFAWNCSIGMFARLDGGAGITTPNMALKFVRVFTVYLRLPVR